MIFLCWLLSCSSLFHYLLMGVVAIYVASAIFLIFILGYPFRGYSALTPRAFEVAVNNILSEQSLLPETEL
jgi:hypothetical protein